MQTQLTFLQEASHVKPSPLQERALSTYRSGKKCSELFARLNPDGLLRKTFMEFLLERKDMHSKLCVLTWKAKVISSSRRLLFQLVARERPIEGIEYGLLPTPTVMDTNGGDLNKVDARRAKAKSKKINGNGFGMTLSEMGKRGLLPTPTHRDYRSGFNPENTAFKKRRNRSEGVNLHEYIQRVIGHNFLLNHRYQLEMMGFPVNWTEAMRDLEPEALKQEVTQLSRRSLSKSSKQ